MTALDSVIQQVVTRLDFTNYKELIRGLTQFGLETGLGPPGRPAPREFVQHLEADVVPRARVLVPRIPQTDDEPHDKSRV